MVDVVLNDEVIRRLIANHDGRTSDWLESVATQIVSEIKQGMLSSGATGRVYGDHVASSPGSPPRPDTGALLNSMKWERVGHLEYQISDGVEYGIHLEFGTSQMEPRPFVNPVFMAWGDKIAEDARRNLLR